MVFWGKARGNGVGFAASRVSTWLLDGVSVLIAHKLCSVP